MPETGPAIRGKCHGGQQPIQGAHVYLFAAGTAGYGKPSVSLLNPAATGHSDAIGAYVLSDANGAFTITGDYGCTSVDQVYVYALGGNPGAGTNLVAGLLAVLGQCPTAGNFLSTIPLSRSMRSPLSLPVLHVRLRHRRHPCLQLRHASRANRHCQRLRQRCEPGQHLHRTASRHHAIRQWNRAPEHYRHDCTHPRRMH